MQEVNIGKISKLDYSSNEAYKSLRTNIEFCGKEVKVIGLTSCIPNEGKSSVAINIARSFAESGKRVLLIDSDMRKSVMVGRYRISSKGLGGLSHLLSGYREIDVVMCETNIENFYILLSGPTPPNPSELLGNDRFKEFIKTAREYVDYIIIDCPPLGSVIDAAIVAKECDGAIIVIETDNVSYKIVQRVKKQLDQSGCRILGAVLNKVEMGGKGYYGKGYYGNYYGRYYGDYGNYGESKES